MRIALLMLVGLMVGCGGKPPATPITSTPALTATPDSKPTPAQITAAAELAKQQQAIDGERAALALEHAALQAEQKKEINRLSRVAEIKRLQDKRSDEASERGKLATLPELAEIAAAAERRYKHDLAKLGSLSETEAKKVTDIFTKFLSGAEVTAEEEEVLMGYNEYRDIVISMRKTHPPISPR